MISAEAKLAGLGATVAPPARRAAGVTAKAPEATRGRRKDAEESAGSVEEGSKPAEDPSSISASDEVCVLPTGWLLLYLPIV